MVARQSPVRLAQPSSPPSPEMASPAAFSSPCLVPPPVLPCLLKSSWTLAELAAPADVEGAVPWAYCQAPTLSEVAGNQYIPG